MIARSAVAILIAFAASVRLSLAEGWGVAAQAIEAYTGQMDAIRARNRATK